MEKISEAVELLEICIGNSKETEDFVSPFYYHTIRIKDEFQEAKSLSMRRVTYDHSLDGENQNFNFFLIGHQGVGKSTFLTKLAFLYKGLLPPRDCLQYSNEIQNELFSNIKKVIKSGKYEITMINEIPDSFSKKLFPILLDLLKINDFENLLKDNYMSSLNDELSANYR